MRKYLFVVGFLIFKSLSFANDVSWEEISRGNLDLGAVYTEKSDQGIIYFGSRKGVFKSEDAGESYRNILSIKGDNKKINYLTADSKDASCLYAATGGGLFYSDDKGRHWQKVFRGKDYLENECTSIAVLPSAIYLGTKAGLFYSSDHGRSWHRCAGKLGNAGILSIAYGGKGQGAIYAACVEGVFRTTSNGEVWEKIFTAYPTEGENGIEAFAEDNESETQHSTINFITIDPIDQSNVYLTTSRGIEMSKDMGATWETLPDYGLLSRDVRFLLVADKSRVYAATKSGIFEFLCERWQEISFGLSAQEIRSLAMDNQGNLYAACDNGLFKADFRQLSSVRGNNNLELYYKDEPPINVIQRAAAKYAEVEPEKIIEWRKNAAKKALLPQLSIGVNRNVTDLWHWETGSSTRAGDDVLVPGNDAIGWDVTLSWDLGDIIWNNDQTSIDVRSRLMVQLRDDILDEVTKLYFERIRVKMELNNLGIEERKKRLEKELRLQELTASLDALTGGFFSQRLKDKT